MCESGVQMPPLDPSLPVPLAMVVAGLAAMGAQEPADIPGAQALLEAQVLLTQADVIRALSLRRIADVDARQLHALDDSPTTSAWVAEQQTSMARSDVALAKRLERHPQVAARIAAGGLSIDGGVRIARALAKLRPHVDRPDGCIDGQPGEEALFGVIVNGVRGLACEAWGGLADDDLRVVRLMRDLEEIVGRPVSQLARLEAAFLVLARCVEPGQVKGALGELVDALLPNELAKRAEDAHTNRGVDLVLDDDSAGWTIGGRLDLETGEMLNVALNAMMETDPDNPIDTATADELRAQGLDPYEDGCGLIRSRRQRRHDALKLLLARLLESGALGQRGKQAPQIAITISEPALHDQPGALPGRARSGARWPAGLVRKLICDSAITRFVLSLGHRVIESSHTERTLKPHERRIKHLETGGVCQAAGCNNGDATGHRLVPHHPTPYSIDPVTSLADSVLLCDVTHRDVHVGGRTVRLKDGRVLGPHGWVLPSAA